MNRKIMSLMLASMLASVSNHGITGTEGESYIGAQYGIGDYDEDGVSKTFNPTALIGVFGYYFHPNFSVEGRVGIGLQDDTQFVPEFGLSGVEATLDIEYLAGLYGTGHINLTESSSIYGVLGASNVKATASVPSIPALKATDDETGVSFGVGADIGISKNIALNIEYMRYLNKSDYDLDVIGLGAKYSF
jgi:opacity protein-like surface antigen